MLSRRGRALCWAMLTGTLWGYASEADALCVYGGKHFEKSTSPDFDGRLYARVTLADEFADSALVIRGMAVSSQNVPPGTALPVATVYNIRVDLTFKGNATKMLRYFTERDSGRFDPDVGIPFLLFLNPIAAGDEAREIAPPGAVRVNYNCGKSRPWAKVTAGERVQLDALSKSSH